VVGATAAAFVLYIIAQGQAGFSGVGGFATNGLVTYHQINLV
jgi:aquaporin Z